MFLPCVSSLRCPCAVILSILRGARDVLCLATVQVGHICSAARVPYRLGFSYRYFSGIDFSTAARKAHKLKSLIRRRRPRLYIFLRSSVRPYRRAARQQRRFVPEFLRRHGVEASRFFSQDDNESRFCTIDRISRCRPFVALENRRGLCPRREKIFAIGDPQYDHLCGKRLWQARRRITLFISAECWPRCFPADMSADLYSSRALLSGSCSIKL